jgi:hypothetical protein
MFAAVLFASALHAQVNRGNLSATGTFPLALVLEGAMYAENAGAWRPDWSFDLPPDAFKVLDGELSRANIVGEGYNLSLAFHPDGFIEEFPFILAGRMVQVSLVYNDIMEIGELTITFPAGEGLWEIEFLEHEDSLPTLARGFHMNTWYFIYIIWGLNEIHETWYDADGNFLGVYSFNFVYIDQNRRIRTVRDFFTPNRDAEFHYDSRGLITDVSFTGGLYRVLYFREDLPRYWERRSITGDLPGTGNFSFQWDVNGILVRITRGSYDDGGIALDFRYEYDFDERGNWIMRREIRMIRSMGHFVPSLGTVFRRVLEYKGDGDL